VEHTDLELYIQIRDGQPYTHPIFADNFKLAFPDVDVNDLPADRFAKFIRVDAPVLGTYEVYEGVTYQWFDGVVKDVHSVRLMTDEERATKDAEIAVTKATRMAKLQQQVRIERCQTTADETEDATQKQLWLDCMTAHEVWVLESVDPITPPFPRFPIKDEAGSWVAP
jgi:hypothetical protein